MTSILVFKRSTACTRDARKNELDTAARSTFRLEREGRMLPDEITLKGRQRIFLVRCEFYAYMPIITDLFPLGLPRHAVCYFTIVTIYIPFLCTEEPVERNQSQTLTLKTVVKYELDQIWYK